MVSCPGLIVWCHLKHILRQFEAHLHDEQKSYDYFGECQQNREINLPMKRTGPSKACSESQHQIGIEPFVDCGQAKQMQMLSTKSIPSPLPAFGLLNSYILLQDMMSEQVFDYLRTREQLGYDDSHISGVIRTKRAQMKKVQHLANTLLPAI